MAVREGATTSLRLDTTKFIQIGEILRASRRFFGGNKIGFPEEVDRNAVFFGTAPVQPRCVKWRSTRQRCKKVDLAWRHADRILKPFLFEVLLGDFDQWKAEAMKGLRDSFRILHRRLDP